MHPPVRGAGAARAVTLSLSLLALAPAHAAEVRWDNGATINGQPETSWFADDNWSTDAEPGAGDDVLILSHGDADPVHLDVNMASVKSIICRVPFDLGSTLTVSAPSEFADSIAGISLGTIRANGAVTLKGDNDGRRTTFEGTAGFRNEGDLQLASRPVTAPFVNAPGAEVELTAGSITLTDFDNRGRLQLGPSGNPNTNSTILNQGTVIKDDPASSSTISGNFIQTSGSTEVGDGATLVFGGLVQRFSGGSLTSHGTLRLSNAVGGTPTRTFDGLASVSGTGTVHQVFVYDIDADLSLDLNLSPGYQAGNLNFASGTTLTNNGILTFDSTEVFTTRTGNPLSASFVNAGTVEVDSSNNPLLEVYTENQGTWHANNLRLGTEFENTGTLKLDGNFNQVSATGGGFLSNPGLVSYDPTVPNGLYDIRAEVRNRPGGKIEAVTGRLTIDKPSPAFSGEVATGNTNATVRILGSEYIVSAGDLTFSGFGKIELGTSSLRANFSHDGNVVRNAVGQFSATGGSSTPGPDDDEGLRLINAELYAPTGGAVVNGGVLRWFRADILADLSNAGLVVLESATGKSFDGTFTQSGDVVQKAALAVEPGSTLRNTGEWFMTGPSDLTNTTASPPDPADFVNTNLLRHTHTGTSTVHLDFTNDPTDGSVYVDAGTLSFLRPTNLDAGGTLRGGSWFVAPGAAVTFPRTMVALDDGAHWDGGSSSSVTSVSGGSTFAPASGQTNPPLTVTDSTLEVSGTFTTPTLTLDNAVVTGVGTVVGDVVDLGGTVFQTGGLNSTGTGTYHSTTRQDIETPAGGTTTAPTSFGGDASVGGTIAPRFALGQQPLPGDTFPVVSSGGTLTGTFDFVDHSQTSGRVKFTPGYTGDTALLTAALTTYPTYEDWCDDNFSAADCLDPTVSGKLADPDNDGLSNFREYCHATAPRAYSQTPYVSVEATPTRYTISFDWADGMTDAEFSVLTGTDPSNLQATTPDTVTSTSDGAVSRYTCEFILEPLTPSSTHYFISVFPAEPTP